MKHSDKGFRLETAYSTHIDTVANLFNKNGEGFFVPQYQREYTWENDNIDQLFDDLLLGILELTDDDGDTATTFFGTTIFVPLVNKRATVYDGDERAEPTQVQLVIDGQQRLSTIALLAIRLSAWIRSLKERLPTEDPYSSIHHHCVDTIRRLQDIYAVQPGRGADPAHKPKIIRATEDLWTYSGPDTPYRSPVASYLAKSIRAFESGSAIDCMPDDGGRVHRNVELIDKWIRRISYAHRDGSDPYGQFPIGTAIASDRLQRHVLGFVDAAIDAMLTSDAIEEDTPDDCATALYHLFLLAYYILHRCVVNRLYPTREEWGFDMFQALNATGTPLTAMETFLPQVMQAEDAEGNDWPLTPSATAFEDIDRLFESAGNNQAKNKRTNELLGAFCLCHDGKKLGNRFSAQRRWMTRCYDKKARDLAAKRVYVRRLSDVAQFYCLAWYMEDVRTPNVIRGLEEHHEGELASFLVQYLRDANSKLSAAILARFYGQARRDPDLASEFVEAAKACAAYFTLVRSTRSTTSGLDDIYRRYFGGSQAPVPVTGNSWLERPGRLHSQELKEYFRKVLNHRGVGDKRAWVKSSEGVLLYRGLKTVVRFVLFVAGDDRIPDSSDPGLTKPGTRNTCSLLSVDQWRSRDLKSIEHVAPQKPPPGHDWDSKIYSGDRMDEVGNLLLLPVDINRFAANKNWRVKYLHYCHLGEGSQERIAELKQEAKRFGINLSGRAISALRKAGHICVLRPVVDLGLDGEWNARLVNRRTKQIKEVVWERLTTWLDG